MFKIKILLFLAIFAFCFGSEISCENCHKIEKFDTLNHDFDCVSCHKSKISPSDFPQNLEKFGGFSHENIIAHPASVEHYGEFCAQCHSEKIAKFESSAHFTHKNEINTIFRAFNVDLNLSLQNFIGANFPNLNEFESLITDLTNRKCLKCHIYDNGESFVGSAHGRGCMACHAKYNERGIYTGSDKNASQSPHSRTHALSRPDNATCQTCHNKYFIGAEYSGLFPQNTHKDYRTPLQKNGNFPPLLHGVTYQNLRSDVHFDAGLQCSDCHSMKGTKSCQSCHEPSKTSAHEYHQNVECSACHSAWGGSFYELNLMLDFSSDYENWQNLIEFDSVAKNLNAKALRQNSRHAPKSRTLSGEKKSGIWHGAFSLERFENVILMRKTNGKISLARPVFGYNLSVKDANKTIRKFDNKFEIWRPFAPHTITKNGKTCEACHENSLQKGESLGGISALFSPKFCQNSSEANCTKMLGGATLGEHEIANLKSILYKKVRAREILK